MLFKTSSQEDVSLICTILNFSSLGLTIIFHFSLHKLPLIVTLYLEWPWGLIKGEILSSSVLWPYVLIGLLHSWIPEFNIKNQREIHSSITYLEKAELVDPFRLQVKLQPMSSNLKSCLGHWQTCHPGSWLESRKPSTQWCSIIPTLTAYIAMKPCLLQGTGTLQENWSTLRQVLSLILLGLATLLSRNLLLLIPPAMGK